MADSHDDRTPPQGTPLDQSLGCPGATGSSPGSVAARFVSAAVRTSSGPTSHEAASRAEAAELESSAAQVVVTDLVLLGLLAWFIASTRTTHLWARLGTVALTVTFGAVLIAFKALIHHSVA